MGTVIMVLVGLVVLLVADRQSNFFNEMVSLRLH